MTIYDTAWWQANPEHMPDQRNGTRAWAYELQEVAIAGQLSMLASVMANTGERINSVLEVGCGYGRVTRVVYDTLKPEIYCATDTSAAQIELALKYGDDRRVIYSIVDLDARIDESEPIDGENYDLVVASEVLMHRTPGTVERDIAALASFKSRYILTVDWQEDGDRKAEGCYRHDYAALFGKYGFVTEIPLPKIRQAIFLTAVA